MDDKLKRARLWFKSAATLNFFFTLGGTGSVLLGASSAIFVFTFCVLWLSIVALCVARGCIIMKSITNEH